MHDPKTHIYGPKDFMLGNYVYFYRTQDSEPIVVKINAITTSKIGFTLEHNENGKIVHRQNYARSDRFKPIKLTDEVVKHLGFEKGGRNFYVKDIDDSTHVYIPLNSIDEFDTPSVCVDVPGTTTAMSYPAFTMSPVYVHDVQNMLRNINKEIVLEWK